MVKEVFLKAELKQIQIQISSKLVGRNEGVINRSSTGCSKSFVHLSSAQ